MSDADSPAKNHDDCAMELSIGLTINSGTLCVIASPPDIGGSLLLAEIAVDLRWQAVNIIYLTDRPMKEVTETIERIVAKDRVKYKNDGIEECSLGDLDLMECRVIVQISEAMEDLGKQSGRDRTVVICDCPSLFKYADECNNGGMLISKLNSYAHGNKAAIIAHMELSPLPREPQEEIDIFVRDTGLHGFTIDEPVWRPGHQFSPVVQKHIDAMMVMQRRTVSTYATDNVRRYLGNRVFQVTDRSGQASYSLLEIDIEADELSFPPPDEPPELFPDKVSFET